MYPNNGSLAQKFDEQGYNLAGRKTRSARNFSPYSQDIEDCCIRIDDMAKDSDLDTVITGILNQSADQLKMYALGKHESPEKKLLPLICQCVILRMADIGKTAATLDTTDDDASVILENAEYDTLAKKHKNAKFIPDALTVACLTKVIERIIDNNIASGGSGRCADICASLRENQFNGFIKQSEIPLRNGVELYNNYSDLEAGGNYDVIAQSPDATDAPITPPQTMQAVPTSGGGILGFIDKAIATVKDASGAISSVGDTLGNAIDKVKDKASDAAGDIAANSLKAAIVKNLPLILGVVVAIVAIILIMVYVAKGKNR